MRKSQEGHEAIRSLLQQVLRGLEAIHAANITHRDIKPDNMLIRMQGHVPQMHLRIIDFGSALDPFAIGHLYGAAGPSMRQQTLEYAPPEALLSRWPGGVSLRRTWPYDMWSLGVTFLELILASPHVFTPSARTRATLHHRLAHLPEDERSMALYIRGLIDFCIYPPRPRHKHSPVEGGPAARYSNTSWQSNSDAQQGRRQDRTDRHTPETWSCSDEAQMQMVRSRDPAAIGLPSIVALRLLQAVLHWSPGMRPTASQTLRHAYFVVPLADQQQLQECSGKKAYEHGWC